MRPRKALDDEMMSEYFHTFPTRGQGICGWAIGGVVNQPSERAYVRQNCLLTLQMD